MHFVLCVCACMSKCGAAVTRHEVQAVGHMQKVILSGRTFDQRRLAGAGRAKHSTREHRPAVVCGRLQFSFCEREGGGSRTHGASAAAAGVGMRRAAAHLPLTSARRSPLRKRTCNNIACLAPPHTMHSHVDRRPHTHLPLTSARRSPLRRRGHTSNNSPAASPQRPPIPRYIICSNAAAGSCW